MLTSLRQSAAELGLAAIGIAPAIPEVLDAYPWARSVIVAAISYLPPEPGPVDDAPRGLVARFARGIDYHTVLRAKLSSLAETIAPARAEVCVDTAPLPERKLAVLAGIAWRGWNGNVFVEGCGSYVSLGEIVTDVPPHPSPLPPWGEGAGVASPPWGEGAERACTDCGRCIAKCPTGAIVAPYTVDRSRCLSYLTQSSGIVPLDLRGKLDNRVYGCDVCQEVCPQNAGVRPVTPEFAQGVFPGAYPELIPLIDLTSDEFKSVVADSSIGWIRRARIRRNASIAAGNLKSEESIPALTRMLTDENPVLRAHAAWALKEFGG